MRLAFSIFVLTLCLPRPGWAQQSWTESVPEFFQSMEGRWVGSYELRTQDGTILRYLDLEYQYWMDGKVLKGLAVFSQGDSLSHSRSRSYLQGKRLISEVEDSQTQEIQRFQGILKNDTITWIPLKPEDRGNSKIKEQVVQKPDKAFLLIEGFERVTQNNQSTRVHFSGLLERVEANLAAQATN